MATANETIQSSRLSVAKLVEGFRDGSYYVDDSFQRRLVWGEKQKVRLIETVLMGYPIPEIYIHQQPTDPKTGKQRFSIVDGQQRISSLSQFVSNEWMLKSTYLDIANRSSDYADDEWTNLSTSQKSIVYDYMLNVRIIPPSIQTEEIRKIFKRLNETDRSLNPQEIRHAEFTGKFLKLAEKIADLAFWENWEVFSDRSIRRMADVEFATSLLSYVKNGVVTDTAANINHLYDLYNDSYPGIRSDEKKIKDTLDMIEYLFENSEEIAEFFNKTVHLYTLFVILDQSGFVPNKRGMINRLKEFIAANEAERKIKTILDYRRGSEQRTRSKTSREQRHEALLSFLKGS